MKTANEKSLQCQMVNLSIIKKLLSEYKNTRGAVIPILQKVQAEYGSLSEPVIDFIAERLSISASEIVGVATFYAQFHLKPRGQHIIPEPNHPLSGCG